MMANHHLEGIMRPVWIRRHFHSRRRRLLSIIVTAGLMLLTMVFALGLAACGGGNDTTTTTTAAPLPEETTTTTLAGGLTTVTEPEGGDTTTTTLAAEETTTTAPAAEETTTTAAGGQLAPGEKVLANANITAMGFIKSIREQDGKRYITIDYAEMLSGREAVDAAREAGDIGPDEDLPNDYYISNPTTDKREFEVSADVAVTTSSWQGEMGKIVTWDVFKSFWSVSPPDQEASFLRDSPWWIERDGQTVIKIDEQYLP